MVQINQQRVERSVRQVNYTIITENLTLSPTVCHHIQYSKYASKSTSAEHSFSFILQVFYIFTSACNKNPHTAIRRRAVKITTSGEMYNNCIRKTVNACLPGCDKYLLPEKRKVKPLPEICKEPPP